LYNERIYDLLNNKKSSGLKLKCNSLTDEAIIDNLFVFDCLNEQDALNYFWKGLKNKVMASHKMNLSSSRSHCILTFTVH
jgi:kinesin family protein 4/21/27